jgi:hypothetical protein
MKKICVTIECLFGCISYSSLSGNINPLNAELNPICHLLALL